MKEQLEALQSVDLLAGLKRKDLELIARVTDRVDLDEGTRFVEQGQHMTHMSIVISGAASVMVDGSPVGTVGPGDVIGELSIIDEAAASASVVMTEPTSLWLVARAGLLPVWDKNRAQISTAMLLAITKKLRETNQRLANYQS